MDIKYKAIPVIVGEEHSTALANYTVVNNTKVLVLSWTIMLWHSDLVSEESERISSFELMERMVKVLVPAFKQERPEIERVVVYIRYVPTLKHHLMNEDGSSVWEFVDNAEAITDGEITAEEIESFLNTTESRIGSATVKYKQLVEDTLV